MIPLHPLGNFFYSWVDGKYPTQQNFYLFTSSRDRLLHSLGNLQHRTGLVMTVTWL